MRIHRRFKFIDLKIWFTLEYHIYISVLCDPIAIHRSVKGLKKYLNNQWTGTTNEEEMIKCIPIENEL